MEIKFNEAVMTIEQLKEWVNDLEDEGVKEIGIEGTVSLIK